MPSTDQIDQIDLLEDYSYSIGRRQQKNVKKQVRKNVNINVQ